MYIVPSLYSSLGCLFRIALANMLASLQAAICFTLSQSPEKLLQSDATAPVDLETRQCTNNA